MKKNNIKKIVKDRYKEIAISSTSRGCSCNRAKNISKSIGYSEEELKIVGEDNLGLGCGNPLAHGRIKEGDVVLDLGSGAGIDAILAAKKSGEWESHRRGYDARSVKLPRSIMLQDPIL